MNYFDKAFLIVISTLVAVFILFGIADGLEKCNYNKDYIDQLIKFTATIGSGYLGHRFLILKLRKGDDKKDD